MKRLIAVAAALFAVAISVFAVPAKPGKFKYTQPDGTVVMLERHGDEFFHWVSDESGQVVVRDSRGFIVPGRLDYGARERGMARKAALARERRSLSTRVENDRASGEKHIPVVKVEGNKVTVQVGEVLHPMMEAHFINFIILETTQGYQKKDLKPGEQPCAEFALAENEKAVAAYEFCNLHGFWKTEI